MTGVPVIAADGAAVTLGDTTLLAPTTFAVLPGEFWCVTGGNGPGKTTLVNLLTGLYLPDTGTAKWDGIDLADASPTTVWRQIAMVPRDCTRWPLTHARTSPSALQGPTATPPY